MNATYKQLEFDFVLTSFIPCRHSELESTTIFESTLQLLEARGLIATHIDNVNDRGYLDNSKRSPIGGQNTHFKYRHLFFTTNNSLILDDSQQRSLTQELKVVLGGSSDCVLQSRTTFLSDKKLICFDMDSTLIQAEVMDELAIHAGVGNQVAAITQKAMQGSLNFDESFIRRLGLIKGIDQSVLASIARDLPLMPGCVFLMKNLKHLGYNTAIISGGFDYFANELAERFNIDHVVANRLDISQNKLTGSVLGEIVNADYKVQTLTSIREHYNLKVDQTVAVGDGANDLKMIAAAGLGLAFHAKPIVEKTALHSMQHFGLDTLLYLLGHDSQEFVD